jgi:3',5'-cyclic AMP phosphodiesterase CpdA
VRVVHLTDPHLVAPGGRLFGLDPLARLDQALAHVRRHEPAAELLLVTGDLTDRGEDAAYAALAERLAATAPPAVLLLGNHDAREAFRRAFPAGATTAEGFVQSVVDGADGVSLVALDTRGAGAGHGALDGGRLDWLEATLAARTDRAVYLAMHHPPVACGIPGMDAIGLADADAFWAVVARAPQVRHVFAGHIHRPFFARRGDVTVSTLPSPAHQVLLQYDAEDAVLGSHEPGCYGVAELRFDGFDLHVRAFTDASPRFVFDDASNRAATPGELPAVPSPYDRLV